MHDQLSPEEIETASFPDSREGYDKARVESFLKTVAEEVRVLQRKLELADERAGRPYAAAGMEIGDLLQHAVDVAGTVESRANAEAARTLQDARKAASDLRHEAESLKQRAEQEADALRRETRAEAAHLKEQWSRMRRTAEAELSVTKQQAEREARAMRQEARHEAEAIRTSSEQAREELRALEQKVMRLQEAEVVLRRKLKGLAEQRRKLEDAPQASKPAS